MLPDPLQICTFTAHTHPPPTHTHSHTHTHTPHEKSWLRACLQYIFGRMKNCPLYTTCDLCLLGALTLNKPRILRVWRAKFVVCFKNRSIYLQIACSKFRSPKSRVFALKLYPFLQTGSLGWVSHPRVLCFGNCLWISLDNLLSKTWIFKFTLLIKQVSAS